MSMRALIVVLAVGTLPGWARGEIKPHALCGEGMVLQQKGVATIWGTADQDEQVTISFRGGDKQAQPDDKGNWSITIDAGTAGGPFAMTIKGKNTISYKDVFVGEVWLCSGQSNMEWKVGNCDQTDKTYASSASPNPMLRVFTVKKNPQTTPQSEASSAWVAAEPSTVNSFTATGYFFGRALQEKLKIPVGLIHSSWGGTRIEAWMNGAALESAGVKEGETKKVNANTASALYNGMIHPLLNYRLRGAIWYQGESNAGNAYKYRTLHTGMIESWRKEFHNPELAFYFVQLAPFGAIAKEPGASNWAELREAQTMTLKLKNTGQAVITDFGNEYDIHPTPKRPVGERLALAALAGTYGEKIVYSGPMFKAVRFEGNKAIVSFDHVGDGLITKELAPTLEKGDKAAWRVKEGSTGAALIGFTVCGEDKVFHPAQARIDRASVVLSCDMVDAPIAVRFGWANHPLCNLFNREGLPASPFRTDDFPGVTAPKQ